MSAVEIVQVQYVGITDEWILRKAVASLQIVVKHTGLAAYRPQISVYFEREGRGLSCILCYRTGQYARLTFPSAMGLG